MRERGFWALEAAGAKALSQKSLSPLEEKISWTKRRARKAKPEK